jgi:uncharacterized membrane protein YedE/YeeE
MVEFTPVSAAIGGALIGLASVLLMLLLGRIAGITGIFAGLLLSGGRERAWRGAFVAGLLAAPLAAAASGYPMAMPEMPGSFAVVAVAGLLVGFGTRTAGGCTSGHGVCGMARFSPRSIVATCVFMATAIAVVAVTRHVL